MYKKILFKDLKRNKAITTTLFFFILLSSLLVSGAVGIISQLTGSLETLFSAADAPHFVQMHSGEIDQDTIDSFASEHELVSDWQTVTMLNITGTDIFLGNNEVSEAGSIMENSFVTQNHSFDFLLDTDNQIAAVEDSEIGVPIYHMQQYGLQLGDTVQIVSGSYSKSFTIKTFIRDAQMNPSIVTSKRFLISENDWNEMHSVMGEIEYLIEFKLTDASYASDFEGDYQASGLPQKDTAITYSLYKLLNGLSDGLVAAIVILIAVLLILIACLCLRFTIIATIEEDYREIGVMKAIGIRNQTIRTVYLLKYITLGAAACICGYLISLLSGNMFTSNMTLYMGSNKPTLFGQLLPLFGTVLVFLWIVLFCRQILKRFWHISAMDAIRTGASSSIKKSRSRLKLTHSKISNINLYLGCREVIGRFRTYGLLCFVFIICTFLMIVPLNFQTTIQSPAFVTYMGAGQSDIRVDLQQTENITKRYNELIQTIQNDPDVERYASFVTSSYLVQNSEGEYEPIKVENGDFDVFPLLYSDGHEPIEQNQIALSVMNAKELGKTIGDSLSLKIADEEVVLEVCGIYQDITNGGKTAKALLPHQAGDVLWYVVNFDVTDDTDIAAKTAEYTNLFYPAKVTDMSNYVSQTMGSILDQLQLVVVLGFILSLCVAALISAMFFKMQLAKDRTQIAIMKSIGFSDSHIQIQYLTQALTVLIVGILLGIAASGTLGQKAAGLLLSGVSSLKFVVNPAAAYILCPLLLSGTVIITVFISIYAVKNESVMNINRD